MRTVVPARAANMGVKTGSLLLALALVAGCATLPPYATDVVTLGSASVAVGDAEANGDRQKWAPTETGTTYFTASAETIDPSAFTAGSITFYVITEMM